MTSDPARRDRGWNLVVSYGDLSTQSGYRTRVLGEFEHLDGAGGLNPFLLVFDRHPEHVPSSSRLRTVHRSEAVRFYPELARLHRQGPVQVVHAHNLYSAALAIAARPRFGHKVVLDYHGRIPEEYVFLGKGGARSRRVLEVLEGWAVRRSDHIVAVSRALAGYLTGRYPIPRDKVTVIPCCADSTLFRVDLESRRRTRRAMGLEDKLVCVHLGSFFEWYESEWLVKVFTDIRSRMPRAHLLVITPDARSATTYLAGRLSQAAFTVTSSAHDRVPVLLNASDIGFLLLRNAPNIRTASPAKFSEYLNCGLPVLISKGVGDFSDLVRDEHLGEVIEGETVSTDFLRCIQEHREELAMQCARIGQSLTWQAYRDDAARVFQRWE